MDLRIALLEAHSRSHTEMLRAWIGRDEGRINELIDLFLNDTYQVVQAAARVLSELALQAPDLVTPFIGPMLQRCNDQGIPVAVKRNVTRILQRIAIPEAHHAAAINLCFGLLADPGETVAVRCFSMGILAQLCGPYPDLKQELKSIISQALEQENPTAGFRSKARRVLPALG